MNRSSIDTINLLRGIVKVIMMLDHTRDFIHNAAQQFDPAGRSGTNVALSLTRGYEKIGGCRRLCPKSHPASASLCISVSPWLLIP